MNFDKPYWRNVLRESDGTPSAARLFVAGIITTTLGLVIGVTVKHGALPDLQSAGMFISATSVTLYGVNKVTTAATNIFGKGPGE